MNYTILHYTIKYTTLYYKLYYTILLLRYTIYYTISSGICLIVIVCAIGYDTNFRNGAVGGTYKQLDEKHLEPLPPPPPPLPSSLL